MTVYVKARPPLARRCRCGYCFDAEGQEVEVSARELAALKADPMLVVTECTTAPPAGGDTSDDPDNAASPEDMPNGTPEDDADEGGAHA